MPRFFLDSNVLIEAKNGPYGFDIAPGFWDWVDSMFETGTIYSSIFVYEELADGKDELSEWIKSRKSYFIEPDENVQSSFSEIADHVQNSYHAEHSAKFMNGADPWVIAHCLATKDILVTHEKKVGPGSKKVKIPNVCHHFDPSVRCINTFQLMRELKARLSI